MPLVTVLCTCLQSIATICVAPLQPLRPAVHRQDYTEVHVFGRAEIFQKEPGLSPCNTLDATGHRTQGGGGGGGGGGAKGQTDS